LTLLGEQRKLTSSGERFFAFSTLSDTDFRAEGFVRLEREECVRRGAAERTRF
jgi:hypothetical protein